MAKVTSKKSAAATTPNQTNAFATKTAGGEKPAGTEKGKANGNGGRGKGGLRRTAPVPEIVISAVKPDTTPMSVRPRIAKRVHQHPVESR